MEQLLQEFHISNTTKEHFGVDDPRFKIAQHSAARYCCELAHLLPPSDEIRAAFPGHELEQCRIRFSVFKALAQDFKASGYKMTRSLRILQSYYICQIMTVLIPKATVIVTTMSNAQDSFCSKLFSPNRIVLEETSRAFGLGVNRNVESIPRSICSAAH